MFDKGKIIRTRPPLIAKYDFENLHISPKGGQIL
jgi:hypothetical protein